MKKTWLIIDVNYLAYRALYTTGHLKAKDNPTGVIYGILHTIFNLRSRFNTDHVVWCFDHGPNKRKKISPTYKGNRRKNATKEQETAIEDMKEQLEYLKKVLPQVYCHNVLMEWGYEADDCIASAVNSLKEDAATGFNQLVIVSADQDMYQLLDKNVSIFDPRRNFEMTLPVFQKQYGIKNPKRWISVKAIAGCSTDNIKGVVGVGEKTAIRYLKGELIGKQEKKIDDFIETESFQLNKKLIRLPLDKLDVGQLEDIPDSHQSTKEWQKLFKKLLIKTLG